MYREYFGFTGSPFSIAPDPRYLYLSEQHREALAHLLYGLSCDGGFVLLTGDVGTGKTTVCRCFLEQLPDYCDVAYILNPKLTARELLSTICDEFCIQYLSSSKSIKAFVDLLNAFLLESHAKGRKALLVIDEAQNLSPTVLEQIRLLTNLETDERKLLQIILLGQPELRHLLARPAMSQLAQRIVARYHLGPLKKGEVAAYVNHRLTVAGLRTQVFPPATINRLYRLSKGIPRLINVLCDRALLGAYVRGRDRVDGAILASAAREVFGERLHNSWYRRTLRILGPAFAIFTFLALAAVLNKYRLIPSVTFKPVKNVKDVQASVQIRKPILVLGNEEAQQPQEVKDQPEKDDKTVSDASAVEQPQVASSAPVNDINQMIIGNETSQASVVGDAKPTAQEGGPQPQDVGSNGVEQNKQAEANAPGKKSGSLEWTSGQPIWRSEAMAEQALFQLWGVVYNADRNARFRDQANGQNLRHLSGNGGLDDLRKYNRPAVLRLYNVQGQPFYAVLKTLGEDTAAFIIGDDTVTVDIQEIALRWQGDYELLWRPPPKYRNGVRLGDRGPVVAWLYTQLAKLRGETVQPPDNPVFDGDMSDEVKKFQIGAGLRPDGIAGPQTLMRIDSEADSGAPVLDARKKDKG